MQNLILSIAANLITSSILLVAQPNVVIIFTDDQGYGDLACLGNPIVKTPHLDKLHQQSIRFSNMHVNSFCTPSRASLMTGRYASRTGAYRTSAGRTMMHIDEITMADFFKSNGYATGLFGKWHLGDSYPHRPIDRGFTEVLWHRCGGVGQVSDYWGNDYFDDVYEHNGEHKRFEGYCTDIWFRGASDFIEKQVQQQKPFFAYIATNAPHVPYIVDKKYSAPYAKEATWKKGRAKDFFGMITNLDENIGKLRAKLQSLGAAENTIFIFMTDNGTSAGVEMEIDAIPTGKNQFNAGMRGRKASVYDGGHRVPCFIHWPKGEFTGGRDIKTIVAGYDILPTLIDLCKLKPQKVKHDGVSIAPLLKNSSEWNERTLVLQYHGGAGFTFKPQKWLKSAVLTQQWRLIDGDKLFDIEDDPSQSNDVASQHPAVVAKLREAYESWWDDISPRLTPVRTHIGNEAENPLTLCVVDQYTQVGNPSNKLSKFPTASAPYMLHVDQAGKYQMTLRRYPREADTPIEAVGAEIQIAGQTLKKTIKEDATKAQFDLELETGDAELLTYFHNSKGERGGAYFVYVERL